jgi:hypothetical protein
MAYTINKTNGTVLATVTDGTVDTSTDLTLVGKNYAGYGEFLNENYVKLLENFANTVAPTSPLAGQIWWDTTNSLLKTYTGTQWKTISSSTSSTSAPASAVAGDLWWDSLNEQLKVYSGSVWVTIGPAFVAGSGTSGAIVETVTDNVAVDHVVVKLYVANTVVGTVSKDAQFTPQVSLTGFTTISPGIQISTNVSGAKMVGTSTDADALGGVAAANYLRSDASDSTSGVLSVLNDTGVVVGVDSDFTLGISGSDVQVKNVTNNGDIIFNVNDGGSDTTALTIDGSTSRLLVAGDPTALLGVATKQYVDTLTSDSTSPLLARDGGNTITGVISPDGDGTRNFGAVGAKFATIYATTFSGTATVAQYADVAENFSADAQYAPGTVVALGGAEEITRVNEEASEQVFGVISDKPAYLMNAGLADGLPVAVTGRVPVRVLGMVNKGERLISAGNGLARAAGPGEATSFNVIGRAIESKTTEDEGTVEAFVTIN